MPDNNGPAGHPMNEIARQFTAPDGRSSEPTEVESQSMLPSNGGLSADSDPHPPISTPWSPLLLTPEQIKAPAFFVDRQLYVRWAAPGSHDQLSRLLSQELASDEPPEIFNLMLKPAVKEVLPDWQALFSFVYVTLRRTTSGDLFSEKTDSIVYADLGTDQLESAHDAQVHAFQAESCLLGQAGDAADQPLLRAYCLGFEQGTLFLLRPDPWTLPEDGHSETRSTAVTEDHADHKASICVLTARLNDSQRIADTMLPDVFFRMINIVWEATDDVVHSLGGSRAGCSGAQIHYVFKTHLGRNPIFSAICCATRMNSRMQALQQILANEHGWVEDICLNMGISHGKDDATLSTADNCMEFMIPGGAHDQSSHLSTIATKGEIWVTKNAIAQLPQKLIDQVVLGIDRQGQFVRNFFTRISDLPAGNQPHQPKTDLAALSVARIVQIETSGPVQPSHNKASS